MSEYAYDFVFNYVDVTNSENVLTVVDDSNPVVQAYSGRSAITGDSEFYAEMNRVLGNLHIIRKVHQNIGKLVSFVVDSAGVKFQITLI